MSAVAVLLDPHPSRYLLGRAQWPVFDDLLTRLELLLQCGLSAVLIIRMGRPDVDKGAAELLDVVASHLDLAEVWVGANQSFGPGPGGSRETLERLAARKGITVRTFPSSSGLRLGPVVRDLLAEGRIVRAAKLVGRVPVWHRPRSGKLFLAWKGGPYLAQWRRCVNDVTPGDAWKCDLVLNAPSNCPQLIWPSETPGWIAFAKGPRD